MWSMVRTFQLNCNIGKSRFKHGRFDTKSQTMLPCNEPSHNNWKQGQAEERATLLVANFACPSRRRWLIKDSDLIIGVEKVRQRGV
jgi:hypothetical protein